MFSPSNQAYCRTEIIMGKGLLRAFIFNYSYLSYHRLGSGQTIAMATIIFGHWCSLLILVSFLQTLVFSVLIYFYQSALFTCSPD